MRVSLDVRCHLNSVRYANWSVLPDFQGNRKIYSGIFGSSADECDCGNCLHWTEIRRRVLPSDFQQFLYDLGVDFSKENGLTEYEGGSIVKNRCLYIGNYYLHGKLESGQDTLIVQPDGNGYSFPTYEIQIGFSVGISAITPRSFIPKRFGGVDVLQIVFEVHTSCPDGDT